MALSNASLIAASAAVTAASGAEDKVKALGTALFAAALAEASEAHPLSAEAQIKVAALNTEYLANVADFQTALGL
jgi:hypothetical protein